MRSQLSNLAVVPVRAEDGGVVLVTPKEARWHASRPSSINSVVFAPVGMSLANVVEASGLGGAFELVGGVGMDTTLDRLGVPEVQMCRACG
jgi:hypothetical protein